MARLRYAAALFLVLMTSSFSPLQAGREGGKRVRFHESVEEPPRKKACKLTAYERFQRAEDPDEEDDHEYGVPPFFENFFRRVQSVPRSPEESAAGGASGSTREALPNNKENGESNSLQLARAPFRLSFASVEDFETELIAAVQEHRFMGLEANVFLQVSMTNYTIGVFEIAKAFELMDVPEAQWEEACARLSPIRWPRQTSQAAVGAHVFFHAALNDPHRYLLINAMKPLLDFTRGEKELPEAYQEASQAVKRVLSLNPYLRRRVGIYSLTEAARQGHPFARFILLHYLYGCAPPKRDCTRGNDQTPEYGTILNPDEALSSDNHSFFIAQNEKIMELFTRSGDQLKQFLDIPGIGDYVDLPPEALNNQALLEEKIALGLIRYKRRWIYNALEKNKNPWHYTEEDALTFLKIYREALCQGDFEATHTFGNVHRESIKYWLPAEEKTAFDHYYWGLLTFAIWQGRSGDWRNEFEYRSFEGLCLPVSSWAAFWHLKEFLLSPPLKPRKVLE